MTPALDLRGTAAAFLSSEQGVTYASWRDHHYVEVSLDGGATFTVIADDTAPDGQSTLVVDLSSYAGVNGVNLAFHYTGDYASEWELDDVVVNDTGPPPPPPDWINLPTSFVRAAGYSEDFEAHAGALPPHMAVNELDSASGQPHNLAWCNIGQRGLPLSANSGSCCLEMGLDPGATASQHLVRNALVIGVNGAAAADLMLEFMAVNHGEEWQTWDGVFVSDDGLTWHQAYLGWGFLPAWFLQVQAGDLAAAGADTQGDFYLLFSQEDDYAYGYLDGLGVDDIQITTTGPTGAYLAMTDLVAGSVATLTVDYATPGGLVRCGYSVAGGGPVATPYGDLLLSPPYVELPVLTADASGHAALPLPVPPAAAGMSIWLHALDLGALAYTNGLALVVQ